MNLELLQNRKAEIDGHLTKMANDYQIVVGHKNEIDYWIGELSKPVVNPEEVIAEAEIVTVE